MVEDKLIDVLEYDESVDEVLPKAIVSSAYKYQAVHDSDNTSTPIFRMAKGKTAIIVLLKQLEQQKKKSGKING